MRTAIFIGAGIVLWMLCMALARLVVGRTSGLVPTAIFGALWLIVAAWNLWTGLSHGYSFRDELPIFLIIVLTPTAVALAARRRFP